MGAQVLTAINPAAICSDCAKYVCNAMTFHSKCSDCCEFDFVTEKVEIPDDLSEMEFESLTQIQNVKEIGAYDKYFGCLDTVNNVFTWTMRQTP